MLRELAEYLESPIDPLAETIPQAAEGFAQILYALKGLRQNRLVIKAPPGAPWPYADLSGPEVGELAPEHRPDLSLPPGEIILLSNDATEALGLFPYFTYSDGRVRFAVPSQEQCAILYERLELSPA
jgi:hypothetical protein